MSRFGQNRLIGSDLAWQHGGGPFENWYNNYTNQAVKRFYNLEEFGEFLFAANDDPDDPVSPYYESWNAENWAKR